MFGTFKFNEKTRLSDAIDGLDSRSYTRTACDFCRLKKLRCSGEMKSCERCQATSTPCTYTLSSGTGRGKKRVRRQHYSDSTIGCFPVETERSDDTGLARQRGSGANQESGQPSTSRRSEPSKFTKAAPPPESGDASATSMANSATWPDSGPDFSGVLAFADDGDFMGMDDNLDLSEEMLLSENDSRMWDASPLHSREYLSGLSESTHAQVGEKPKTSREGSGLSADRPLTSREPDFGNIVNELRDHSGSNSTSASIASSSTCGCLSNVARLFETVVSRTANCQGQSIDMLMIDLEDGVAGCKKVLVCSDCTSCSDNPTLVAMVGSHLVGLWDAITHRIIACQRQDRSDSSSKASFDQQDEAQSFQPSPQTFRYGRYAVQSPEMKCHLLNNLIQLHFNNLNELLSYLKIAVRQKPSALEIVEQAATKAARISWAMRREVAGPRSDDQFITKNALITGTGTTRS
ncbi:hypothetical protein F4777DRAFT_31780 [Nemania sp. FL0916]|nr:hypothetical protein F4777DRAFT_31780 [Nemania sp. FL0916]